MTSCSLWFVHIWPLPFPSHPQWWYCRQCGELELVKSHRVAWQGHPPSMETEAMSLTLLQWRQHVTLPELWLTNQTCSGNMLRYFGTWVLLKYKGLMFVKAVQKQVCINERKSLKKISWYLQNIFISVCQTDWHFRYSYGLLFLSGRSIRYSWSPNPL